MVTSKTYPRYSKIGLWQLFTAIAFPMHVWAIILILMDLSWIAERSDFWDAIGVAAYGLMFVFFESLTVFLIAILIGFLFPKNWSEAKRIALLGVLITVILIWAILGQLYFQLGISVSPVMINFFAKNQHPLRILYMRLFLIVTPTVALPALTAVGSEKFQQGFLAYIDRISVLMGFYLFVDFVGIVIVFLRNLG